MKSRRLGGVSALFGLATAFLSPPVAFGAQPPVSAEIASAVRQSASYVRQGHPSLAGEQLDLIEGTSRNAVEDDLVILARANVALSLGDLESAGRLIANRDPVKLRTLANDHKWAQRVLSTFEDHLGAVVFHGPSPDACLEAELKLQAPLFVPERQRLFAMYADATDGRVKLRSGASLYLPVGRYRIAEQSLEVAPRERLDVRVPRATTTTTTTATTAVAWAPCFKPIATVEEEVSGGVDWWWIAGGIAVAVVSAAAAGTTTYFLRSNRDELTRVTP